MQVGDRVAVQGLAADHDLEAVVVGRVVAASDRDAAAGVEVEGAEVHHRRGRQADVDDVAPGLAQAAREAFRSEEHTSELQSLMRISYDVFCLNKKKHKQ